MLKNHLLVAIGLSLSLSGCSEIQTPSVSHAMTHPFGTQAPFERGTSKEEVLEDWGKPDEVIPKGVDELGNTKEEWVYTGRLPGLPIDHEYLSKTKRLFFEGNNLVRWQTEESK